MMMCDMNDGSLKQGTMDEEKIRLLELIEQAAISGICREGQLEMVMQELTRLYPELGTRELSQVAQNIYRMLHYPD